MTDRIPDPASERRLDQLKLEANRLGRIEHAHGIRPAGAPFPIASAATGYYGLPLLKPPVWTWEVPAYFFVGGTAGTAAVLAAAARSTGADRALVRDARRIAAIGAALSAPLLIADLGRPERFLNMLRVLKLRSPMSVGAWTLAAFGAFSTGTVLFEELAKRSRMRIDWMADASGFAAAGTGLVMATYTGVLLGVTAIPVWSEHAALLPAHFATTATASAVALLELRGHDTAALNAIGLGAAAFETASGTRIESHRPFATDPLRRGRVGMMTRLGGFLSGPLPLALRIIGVRSKRIRRVAAVSSLVGSLVTRFAWVAAGRVSSISTTGQK